MDEFNYHSTYSSGWKKITPEKQENEKALPADIHQLLSNKATNCQAAKLEIKSTAAAKPVEIKDRNETSFDKKEPDVIQEVSKNLKQTQNEIISKLNELQNDLLSVKQLLNTLQENYNKIREEEQKKAQTSKLSKFFK